MATQVSYIEPHALASLLRTPEERQNVVVLDVRDDDYEGGHINGSVNITSDQFNNEAALDAVIDSHCAQASRVVVHCMYSQVRGPRCATRLAARLVQRGAAAPAVSVLRGGWMGWVNLYRRDADLVADLSQYAWGQ